jgi:hypothetical protein
MKENTSRFWFVATVVLAAMYLMSNPTLTSKLVNGLSELWQGVISRVKAPEITAKVDPRSQNPLAEPKQAVNPILEQLEQHGGGTEAEAVRQNGERLAGDSEGDEKVVQETKPGSSTAPEVRMEDVLIPEKEKSPAGVSNSPAVDEKDLPLEVLKEIYARHLEALKILNTEADSDKNEK